MDKELTLQMDVDPEQKVRVLFFCREHIADFSFVVFTFETEVANRRVAGLCRDLNSRAQKGTAYTYEVLGLSLDG